jgi:hypothetical protein
MNIAIPWKDVNPDVVDPVRNTGHQYLKFLNSEVFSEEARHFLKYGYYTNAPYGSKDYVDYWDEQEKRCLEGYSVGGVRITGRHYYFLNFTLMKARPLDSDTGVEKDNAAKILTFPRFLDHQYYLTHVLEECMAEGPHEGKKRMGFINLKSRRKGLTYIISDGVFGYNFNFVPASTNILTAYEKQHFKVTLDAIHFGLNHINKTTDWAKRRQKLNKRDHFRASFVYKDDNGVEIEDGYMSEVIAISFKDNPFKGIGESATIFGVEEGGKFHNLLEAYAISEPLFRDGDVMTGIPILWGTGGDMEGGTKDFADMFYNPSAYGLKSFENIYEENAVGDCGYFIDDMWYYPGKHITKVAFNGKVKEETVDMLDNNGNSIRDVAEQSLDLKRDLRRKGNKHAYLKFISQQPKTPSEALLRTQGTIFDVIRAQARLSQIQMSPSIYLDSIWRVRLNPNPETGEIKVERDEKNEPLYEFPLKDNKNKPGVIEIYEMPVRNSDGIVMSGRYIFGIDSFDDDASETNSVGSLIGLDRLTDRIICHYKGRPMANVFYENCRRIIKFYNGIGNYERRNKGIYGYFYNNNCLHLLCDEPEILKERGISKANTIGNNALGTAPSIGVNVWGRELALTWMSQQAYGEEEGSEKTNLDVIRSVPLLKEVIAWNPDVGNYDDVSALGMLMILREDKMKFKVHTTNIISTVSSQDYWFKRFGNGYKNPINSFNKLILTN